MISSLTKIEVFVLCTNLLYDTKIESHKKISKGFEQNVAKNRLDSIQNSSRKPNHQAKGNWEAKLPG